MYCIYFNKNIRNDREHEKRFLNDSHLVKGRNNEITERNNGEIIIRGSHVINDY